MKGLTRKIGETATMEAQVLDVLGDNIRLALNGKIDFSGTDMAGDTGSSLCTTKSDINEGDYITNLALVAPLIGTGRCVKVIFGNALCTSGFEIDTKTKRLLLTSIPLRLMRICPTRALIRCRFRLFLISNFLL